LAQVLVQELELVLVLAEEPKELVQESEQESEEEMELAELLAVL
jgi:hypothetical protein